MRWSMLPILLLLASPAAAAEGPASQEAWDGVALGYENGLWGYGYAQGLTVQIPFGPEVGRHWGARLRGQYTLDGVTAGSRTFRAGVEVFGRGPVVAGILRVYGGGGLYLGVWAAGDTDKRPLLTGGGHYGIEAAVSRRVAFTFEVGGQGPTFEGEGIGASAMAGTAVYLGRLSP